jgi:hypothetical protein
MQLLGSSRLILDMLHLYPSSALHYNISNA